MKRAVLVVGLVALLSASLAAPVDARRPKLCPDRSRPRLRRGPAPPQDARTVEGGGTCDFPYGGFRAPEIGDRLEVR